jgi:hypothetical protein
MTVYSGGKKAKVFNYRTFCMRTTLAQNASGNTHVAIFLMIWDSFFAKATLRDDNSPIFAIF